jgi:hypothetical protein
MTTLEKLKRLADVPDNTPLTREILLAAVAEAESMQTALCRPLDGSWADKYGACRVCGGEIPHGHTNNCDIWKQEQQITDLRRQNAELRECLKVKDEACESAKEFLESEDIDSLECTCGSDPERSCRRCGVFMRQTNRLDKALATQPEVKP